MSPAAAVLRSAACRALRRQAPFPRAGRVDNITTRRLHDSSSHVGTNKGSLDARMDELIRISKSKEHMIKEIKEAFLQQKDGRDLRRKLLVRGGALIGIAYYVKQHLLLGRK